MKFPFIFCPDTRVSNKPKLVLVCVNICRCIRGVFATFIRSLGKKACCPIKKFLDVTNSKLAEILEILERHFAANLRGLAISVSGSTIMRHQGSKIQPLWLKPEHQILFFPTYAKSIGSCCPVLSYSLPEEPQRIYYEKEWLNISFLIDLPLMKQSTKKLFLLRLVYFEKK